MPTTKTDYIYNIKARNLILQCKSFSIPLHKQRTIVETTILRDLIICSTNYLCYITKL